MQNVSVDVGVVGGGPAGLAAALTLGRCRRSVVLIDAGEPRNVRARRIHGFPTRDGIAPAEYVRLARAELAAYPTVAVRSGTVRTVTGRCGAFRIACADGAIIVARRLLLATGVVDMLPEIDGLDDLYGTSAHHCPQCDGFEYADRPVAVYNDADSAIGMLPWTADVVLCTGGASLTDDDRVRCAALGIRIRTEPVARLDGRHGRLERIVFASGDPLSRDGLFFSAEQRQRSSLAAELGCEFTNTGAVATNEGESTRVPGVHVAGDASHREQSVVIAAAEGAMAAMKIHEVLWTEDLAARGARSG